MALLPHPAVDQDRCRGWSAQTVGDRFAIGMTPNARAVRANLTISPTNC